MQPGKITNELSVTGQPPVARPVVWGLFDPRSSSIQYVVSDPATRRCAIVDPVLDFDEKSGATETRNADAILAYVARQWPDGRMDPRHPSPCRSFLGGLTT